jgi:hypothetical protein
MFTQHTKYIHRFSCDWTQTVFPMKWNIFSCLDIRIFTHFIEGRISFSNSTQQLACVLNPSQKPLYLYILYELVLFFADSLEVILEIGKSTYIFTSYFYSAYVHNVCHSKFSSYNSWYRILIFNVSTSFKANLHCWKRMAFLMALYSYFIGAIKILNNSWVL